MEDEPDHLEGENFEQDGAEGEGERHREQPRVENSFARHRLHFQLISFLFALLMTRFFVTKSELATGTTFRCGDVKLRRRCHRRRRRRRHRLQRHSVAGRIFHERSLSSFFFRSPL